MRLSHYTEKKVFVFDCQKDSCRIAVKVDGVYCDVAIISQEITHIDTYEKDNVIRLYNLNEDKNGNLKGYYVLYIDSDTLIDMTHREA